MSQLQNQGGAARLYANVATALIKDKAVTKIGVEIDMSKWSKRKRNIIATALKTGVAACGLETAEVAYHMARSVGSSLNMIHKWDKNVLVEDVKPDRLEDLLAYTAAWMRIRKTADLGNHSARFVGYYYYRALEQMERGERPARVPLNPDMSYDEVRDFIHPYLTASENRDDPRLLELIERVERGDTITITFT